MEDCRASDALDRVLDRLRNESSKYFDRPAVRLHPLRRFNSEASIVQQVRVDGAANTAEIFVKWYKPRSAATEHRTLARQCILNDFETTLRVHRQLAGAGGFSAVRPIACFPDELALVTEGVRGETLGTMLRREAAWWPGDARLHLLERIMRRTGAWIQAFQTAAVGDRMFTLSGMRDYLDVRLRRLTALRRAGFPEAWRTGVLRYFDVRADHVCEGDLREVPIHADIAPGNVLVDGTDITVIDFAMATTGGRFHDVSRLYSQLEFLKYKPAFRAPVVARLQAALLEGFEPGLSPRRPLFELFLVQHTVCHLSNLSRHPGSGLSRAYNWYQRREHRRWLAAACGLPTTA
jgi:hypothetical protein